VTLPGTQLCLGVTAEVLLANIVSKPSISLQRGPVDPKFQVEGVAPTNLFSSQKTRLNDFSYGIKVWTDLSSVLLQSTRLTDRRTDGRTDRLKDRILFKNIKRNLREYCISIGTYF